MNRKNIIFLTPEVYLIGATVYYWILTANLLNPIALILLGILGFQIVYKKRSIGLIIATVFILLNFYMVLALVSELTEFSEMNNGFMQLLLFGSLFLGANLVMSLYMLIKYLKRKNQTTTSENKTFC